jgi:hypothetical protein
MKISPSRRARKEKNAKLREEKIAAKVFKSLYSPDVIEHGGFRLGAPQVVFHNLTPTTGAIKYNYKAGKRSDIVDNGKDFQIVTSRSKEWYELFEKMAGVRGDEAKAISPPKGLPEGTCLKEFPEGSPEGVEDVRWVFWFDN